MNFTSLLWLKHPLDYLRIEGLRKDLPVRINCLKVLVELLLHLPFGLDLVAVNARPLT